MNAYCCATFRTSVFLFLIFEKFLHSVIPNGKQILDYVHIVFLRVAILKFQKMYTWIIWTFKAELHFVFENKITVLL